jgi:hypothetical protein
MDLRFFLIASSVVGNNMSALYLVTSFALIVVFVRNYHGVQRKVSARFFMIMFIFAFVLSVMFPNQITRIASFFGFGRGADFVFYNFVIFSIGTFGLLYKKIVLLERRLVELNRQASIRGSECRDDQK